MRRRGHCRRSAREPWSSARPFVLGVALLTAVAGAPLRAQAQGWAQRLPRLRHLAALAEEAPSARIEAARALRGAAPTPRLRRALREALETTNDPAAIGEIATTLVWHGDRGATPTLVAALGTAPPMAAPAIADALGAFATPEGLEALVAALDVPETAAAARIGLLRAGPRALPWIARALTAAPTLAAIEVAGAIGDPVLVPALALIARRGAAIPLALAAVGALAAIGDGRGAPAVRGLLAAGEPDAVDAAIAALRRIGGPSDASALEALLEGAEPSRERAVLGALLALSPERGRDAIVARVTGADPVAVRRATDVALAEPVPALAAVFHGLFRNGVRASEAASVLAELEGGAGLPALLAEAGRVADMAGAEREALGRALAVAIHRWGEGLSREDRSGALAALRRVLAGGEDTPRGSTLRALAGDETVVDSLLTALAADDGALRTWAAQALAFVGEDERVDRSVGERLRAEESAEVLRALLITATDRGLGLDDAVLTRLLLRSDLGMAAWLALRGPQPDDRRRMLRRALREGDAEARAAAAFALVDTEDWRAWHVLLERVDADEDPGVRRVAAEALARLEVAEASAALDQRARIERDPRVRAALEAGAEGRWRPRPRGHGVLRFAIRANGAPSGVGVWITLPDGMVRWARTLPSGEVFVVGQPAGVADVRVELEDPPMESLPTGSGAKN